MTPESVPGGLRCNTGRQDDGLAKEVLALLDSLAGVQSDAYPDRLAGVFGVVSAECLLDGDGALTWEADAPHRMEAEIKRRIYIGMGIDS